MNDFLQLVNARQSDRAYDKSRLVEADKLERILEAGRLAPSACNAQPWRFVVVTDPSLAEKVGKAAAGLGMNKFAKDAPVHILVVEESANITSRLGGKLKGKHFPLIDIGIVAAHMVLAAESEGLGSCILGWFDEKEIKSDRYSLFQACIAGYLDRISGERETKEDPERKRENYFL